MPAADPGALLASSAGAERGGAGGKGRGENGGASPSPLEVSATGGCGLALLRKSFSTRNDQISKQFVSP